MNSKIELEFSLQEEDFIEMRTYQKQDGKASKGLSMWLWKRKVDRILSKSPVRFPTIYRFDAKNLETEYKNERAEEDWTVFKGVVETDGLYIFLTDMEYKQIGFVVPKRSIKDLHTHNCFRQLLRQIFGFRAHLKLLK